MAWWRKKGQVLGQITPDSALGKWLSVLVLDENVHTIVEVGAWHGGGSTSIIAEATRRRGPRSVHAWCLEANRERASQAAALHAGNPNLDVMWGVVVRVEELDTENLSAEEEGWLSEDIAWIARAPNLLDSLPAKIDLLLLDGGEFSTLAEFRALRERISTWLLLDDTLTRKCREIFRELTSGEGTDFELIWHSDERNGTAVFRRRVNYGISR